MEDDWVEDDWVEDDWVEDDNVKDVAGGVRIDVVDINVEEDGVHSDEDELNADVEMDDGAGDDSAGDAVGVKDVTGACDTNGVSDDAIVDIGDGMEVDALTADATELVDDDDEGAVTCVDLKVSA